VTHEQGGGFGLVWIHDGQALRDDYHNTGQHAMPKKSTVAGVGGQAGQASNFAEATRRKT